MSTALLRKRRGLCGSCNSPPMPGKTRCKECDEKRKVRVLAGRLAGECIQDGCHNIPANGKSRCTSCSEWRSKYDKMVRQERIALGLCANCGKPKKTETKLCTKCKQKSLAITHKYLFGGNKGAALKRDGNECVLCDSAQNILVHHINGNNKDNKLDNLTTLCRRCHADIHRLGNKHTRSLSRELISCHGKQLNTSKKTLSGWRQVRNKVLLRDRHACVVCASKQKRMFVHHRDDRGLRNPNPNNNLGNLVTMCQACHNAITNLRNNTDRIKSARLIILLGPGTQLIPLAS